VLGRQDEHLCKNCLSDILTAKFRTVIKQKHLLEENDRVLAAVSGGMCGRSVRDTCQLMSIAAAAAAAAVVVVVVVVVVLVVVCFFFILFRMDGGCGRAVFCWAPSVPAASTEYQQSATCSWQGKPWYHRFAQPYLVYLFLGERGTNWLVNAG
jgi:hypothetical protein